MSTTEEKLFNEVFLRFHPLLFAFGKKLTSDSFATEEAIQDLFLYLYEKKIDLGSITNMKAYLFTAFRRRVLLKKQTPAHQELTTDIEFSSDDFFQENEIQKKRTAALSQLLNELPWRKKAAIYLKYFNVLSKLAVTELTGIQPQVVSNTI